MDEEIEPWRLGKLLDAMQLESRARIWTQDGLSEPGPLNCSGPSCKSNGGWSERPIPDYGQQEG